MSRKWKILIGVVAALAVLLTINTLVVEGETKSAVVTVPGGRILHLPGGDMQVLEKGPRHASPIVLLHCYTCSIAITEWSRSTCGASEDPKSRAPATRWKIRRRSSPKR